MTKNIKKKRSLVKKKNKGIKKFNNPLALKKK